MEGGAEGAEWRKKRNNCRKQEGTTTTTKIGKESSISEVKRRKNF